ncbi:MAG: S24 family peptidase [Rikenellaceae bacterium]
MSTKMTSWQRLESIIHYARMTTNAFAKSLSLKRSENLYQIKKGNNGISKELADLIVTKYPEVDKLWLLTGEGNMFSNDTTGSIASGNSLRMIIKRGTPFYDVDLMTVAKNRVQLAPAYYIDIPTASDCDFAVKFYGNAMSPVIESGALVFVKEVGTELILFGQVYMVVTPSFAAIRHIGSQPDDPTKVRLVPANALFEVMTISKSDIVSLYVVKGVYQSFI